MVPHSLVYTELHSYVGMFKVGLQLYTSLGPEDLKEIGCNIVVTGQKPSISISVGDFVIECRE